MTEFNHDIVVVGGGMIGAATSYYLAKAGADVLLLERGKLGREASGRNAGTFNLLNDRIRTSSALDQTLLAIEKWRNLSQELNYDLEVVLDKGTMLVAETEQELSRISAMKAIYAEKNIDLVIMQGSELFQFAPYLNRNVAGGLFCAIGGFGNPRQASWAYARRARELGASILENSELLDVSRTANSGYILKTKTQSLRAKKIVFANGPWAVPFVERFGMRLPVRIRYFQVSVTAPAPGFIKHGVRRVAGMLTLKQLPSGHCILGGGWEGISAFPEHGRVSMETIAANCTVAANIVPDFANLQLLRSWAGYDASSPDERAIMQEIPEWENVFVSTGGGGFTGGPVLGELTARMVSGAATPEELAPYRLSRFQ